MMFLLALFFQVQVIWASDCSSTLKELTYLNQDSKIYLDLMKAFLKHEGARDALDYERLLTELQSGIVKNPFESKVFSTPLQIVYSYRQSFAVLLDRPSGQLVGPVLAQELSKVLKEQYKVDFVIKEAVEKRSSTVFLKQLEPSFELPFASGFGDIFIYNNSSQRVVYGAVKANKYFVSSSQEGKESLNHGEFRKENDSLALYTQHVSDLDRNFVLKYQNHELEVVDPETKKVVFQVTLPSHVRLDGEQRPSMSLLRKKNGELLLIFAVNSGVTVKSQNGSSFQNSFPGFLFVYNIKQKNAAPVYEYSYLQGFTRVYAQDNGQLILELMGSGSAYYNYYDITQRRGNLNELGEEFWGNPILKIGKFSGFCTQYSLQSKKHSYYIMSNKNAPQENYKIEINQILGSKNVQTQTFEMPGNNVAVLGVREDKDGHDVLIFQSEKEIYFYRPTDSKLEKIPYNAVKQGQVNMFSHGKLFFTPEGQRFFIGYRVFDTSNAPMRGLGIINLETQQVVVSKLWSEIFKANNVHKIADLVVTPDGQVYQYMALTDDRQRLKIVKLQIWGKTL